MELLGHNSISQSLYGTWWYELLLWAVLAHYPTCAFPSACAVSPARSRRLASTRARFAFRSAARLRSTHTSHEWPLGLHATSKYGHQLIVIPPSVRNAGEPYKGIVEPCQKRGGNYHGDHFSDSL
jgi:hypothetical protein